MTPGTLLHWLGWVTGFDPWPALILFSGLDRAVILVGPAFDTTKPRLGIPPRFNVWCNK